MSYKLGKFYSPLMDCIIEVEEQICVGDILGLFKCGGDTENIILTFTKVNNSKNKKPLAIALQNAIEPYGKLYTLQKGAVLWRFSPHLELPIGQPIYCDIENSSITWKAVGPEIGKLLTPQDKDGYFKVFLNFLGV